MAFKRTIEVSGKLRELEYRDIMLKHSGRVSKMELKRRREFYGSGGFIMIQAKILDENGAEISVSKIF